VSSVYGKQFNELLGETSGIGLKRFGGDQQLNTNSKYDIKQAYNYFIQMSKNLYPEINRYLTTLDDPSFRGI